MIDSAWCSRPRAACVMFGAAALPGRGGFAGGGAGLLGFVALQSDQDFFVLDALPTHVVTKMAVIHSWP
jgi:hypothetical protein